MSPFEHTKTTLRLRTLWRLTGLPSKELEHGRSWRSLDERNNTERLARKAVDWLKRVFIVDSPTGMDVARVRRLVEELLRTTDSCSGALVVIDNNQHSPNENVRLGHFFDAVVTIAAIMTVR